MGLSFKETQTGFLMSQNDGEISYKLTPVILPVKLEYSKLSEEFINTYIALYILQKFTLSHWCDVLGRFETVLR